MSTIEWIDRLDELSHERSFVVHIIDEAYRVGNELLVEEFEAKLKNIDTEINQLLK